MRVYNTEWSINIFSVGSPFSLTAASGIFVKFNASPDPTSWAFIILVLSSWLYITYSLVTLLLVSNSLIHSPIIFVLLSVYTLTASIVPSASDSESLFPTVLAICWFLNKNPRLFFLIICELINTNHSCLLLAVSKYVFNPLAIAIPKVFLSTNTSIVSLSVLTLNLTLLFSTVIFVSPHITFTSFIVSRSGSGTNLLNSLFINSSITFSRVIGLELLPSSGVNISFTLI